MAPEPSGRRRVVVTGLGGVTPLGGDAETSFREALAGRSAVRVLEAGRTEGLPTRLAAPAPEALDPGDVPHKEWRRYDRAVALALVAAREALADAGLASERDPDPRAGSFVASAIGGVGTLLANHRAFLEGGPRRVTPHCVPMSLPNMPGAVVAIRHGLAGPSLCTATACASGAHALGEAMRTIERGDADWALAGGSESCLEPLVVAGFARMQALSKRDREPERASRPFDRERDGFVLGEGAALLVLEAETHARSRGARARARLAGYGATADAAHVAAPDPGGAGAERCMRRALEDAELAPEELGFVSAHATSTPAGDRVEAAALARLLGAAGAQVPVTATKGATGHLLGAAGAFEALVCARALESGRVPPTANLEAPDEGDALAHVRGKALEAPGRSALSNAFGFGGANAALVLAAAGEA